MVTHFHIFYLTLRIIGPSKLAILKALPLVYRFIHPSIEGSNILRVRNMYWVRAEFPFQPHVSFLNLLQQFEPPDLS